MREGLGRRFDLLEIYTNRPGLSFMLEVVVVVVVVVVKWRERERERGRMLARQ